MTRPKKGIDIPDIPGYKTLNIKPYLIVIARIHSLRKIGYKDD